MKGMPPLPNRRFIPANQPPSMQIVSNKMKLPQRYNSVQRVLKEVKEEFNQTCQNMHKQNRPYSKGQRQNALMKRPMSARQNSSSKQGRSIESRGSKESLGSREGSHRVRRHSPHYSMKMRVSMPSVSAFSWVLYEMREEKFIYGKSNFKRREVASLTKIMNLYTILQFLQTHGLIATKIRLNVTKQACTLIGTTAQLKPNIEISLQDLFYGMMLPSGNDAAYQVAQIGGTIINLIKQGQFDKNIIYNCQQLSYLINKTVNAVGLYLSEMNQLARKLGLTRTNWANPHGLSNVNNLSTAEDMAQLCMHAMKISAFRDVVATKVYNCPYYYDLVNEETGENDIAKGILKWENTNKMLVEGWSGIKTGITPNAGPCLAASCRKMMNGREYEFLVILIRSESMEHRWVEVRKLVDWIVTGNWYNI